ncbi:NAD(P)H-binding protein [Microbacterium sp. I2]|uniref:NmrA family NAD(P)-binding protein n=1 Tax=Microbacterium sp. I2 TaxID=3391826 RepID=UPI003ED8F49D
MFVIMGGTGQVGSAVADALLRDGEDVTIVTRSAQSAAPWRARGASIAVADIDDAGGLRDVFRMGRRALLLNPPADPSEDTDAVEHRTVDNILDALEGSGLEKVVAVSTYGAAPGERIGDLGTLWRMERGLAQQEIPAAVNRGAYYMSNWNGLIDAARESGALPTMLPADLTMPMVAPADVGEAAAQRLVSDVDDIGIRYVEGPRRYTAADVARVLARQLNREVRLEVIPPEDLEATFTALGFSPAAASSYAGMTRLTIDGPELPDAPWRGSTTLEQYVKSVL